MNIVITGASKGIGYSIAKAFTRDPGHHVLGIARNTERMQELSDKTDNRFGYIGFDLQSGSFHDKLIPEVKSRLGTVDILINNAGALLNKPFAETSDAEFDTIFDMNIRSPFRLIRDMLPLLAKGAHIVNISSMGGVQGSVKFPGLSVYSTSKGALAVLTECLALELEKRQIRVNALALGAVQTEMLAKAFPGYNAPLQSEEMAEFVKEFATSGHHFFNGKILPVSLSTP